MGSAVLLRSKATSRQRKSSSLIRSASSTSTSPKCRPPRGKLYLFVADRQNFEVRLRPTCRKSQSCYRIGLPGRLGPRALYLTPIHQDQSSLDQRPGRTNEPHDQGRNRQRLSLRRSRPVAPPSRRLPRRLQFRTPPEDPQRPHAIRVRLKMLDFRARPIQTQPTPSNAGTEHLGLSV